MPTLILLLNWPGYKTGVHLFILVFHQNVQIWGSERNQKDPNVFMCFWVLSFPPSWRSPVIVPVTQRSDWDLEGLPYRVQCVLHHLCLMTDGKSDTQNTSKRRNHNIGDEKQSVWKGVLNGSFHTCIIYCESKSAIEDRDQVQTQDNKWGIKHNHNIRL